MNAIPLGQDKGGGFTVHRKTLVRLTDTILSGEEPGSARHLVQTGWLKEHNGKLIFGEACGAVVGLSVKRESLAWVVAGLAKPLAEGQLDARILPVNDDVDRASVDELEGHLTTALQEVAKQLPTGLGIGAVGVAWPGSVGPSGEARDYPIFHAKLGDPNTERNPSLVPIVRNALEAAGLSSKSNGSSLRSPVIEIVNDADADLLFEARRGVARGVSNVMGVKICGGIGMGIMLANRLVSEAGHIEHIKVHREPEKLKDEWGDIIDLDELRRCSCTGSDCVGRFASGAAIIEQLDDYFASKEMTPNERGRQIEREPSQGTVTKVCGRAGRLLGQALIGPVLALNPQRLVVNAFPQNEHLFNGIRTALTEGTPVRLGWDDILEGTKKCETTAAGAAQLVIERNVVPQLEREFSGGKWPQRHDLPPWLRLQVPSSEDAVPDYQPV